MLQLYLIQCFVSSGYIYTYINEFVYTSTLCSVSVPCIHQIFIKQIANGFYVSFWLSKLLKITDGPEFVSPVPREFSNISWPKMFQLQDGPSQHPPTFVYSTSSRSSWQFS